MGRCLGEVKERFWALSQRSFGRAGFGGFGGLVPYVSHALGAPGKFSLLPSAPPPPAKRAPFVWPWLYKAAEPGLGAGGEGIAGLEGSRRAAGVLRWAGVRSPTSSASGEAAS